MEKSIQGYLGSLQIGEVQLFKNLAMVPVVSDYDDGLGYITLGEALGAGSIEIREVSEGGSVPELRVVNRAGKMVLILDGEELVGAKQNRIVNTTILVAAGCEIVIPVSCVEQGRWNYKSDVFSSKQRMMSPSIRQVKAKDVNASLRSTGQYRSDQSAIWQEVAGLASRRGAVSESMDMDLVFDKEAPSDQGISGRLCTGGSSSRRRVPGERQSGGHGRFRQGGDILSGVQEPARKLRSGRHRPFREGD